MNGYVLSSSLDTPQVFSTCNLTLEQSYKCRSDLVDVLGQCRRKTERQEQVYLIALYIQHWHDLKSISPLN